MGFGLVEQIDEAQRGSAPTWAVSKVDRRPVDVYKCAAKSLRQFQTVQSGSSDGPAGAANSLIVRFSPMMVLRPRIWLPANNSHGTGRWLSLRSIRLQGGGYTYGY